MASTYETNGKELAGVEPAVAEAAEEAPAAGGDESSPQNRDADPVREAPLYKLTEQLVVEAHKLAQRAKEEAIREAETEAATIRADAEVEAREQVLEPARAEANAQSRAIMAEAEQEAQRVSKSAGEEARGIVQAAKQKADHMESEAEFRIRKLTDKVTAEIRSALSDISKLLPTAEDSGRASGDELKAGTSSVLLVQGDGVEDKPAAGSVR